MPIAISPLWVALSLVGVLAGLGVSFGFLLAWTHKKLGVYVDPLVDEVDEELPKGQCGGCGFAGCRQYAEAVVTRADVAPNLCTPGGNDVARVVARMTGKAELEVAPRKAVVLCAGVRDDNCSVKHVYEGMEDCDAAALLWGGDKVCEAGCLGLGNCSRACPHDALHMDPRTKLPVVVVEKCIGCGLCVGACPRGVLALVPASAKSYIACRNTDKGAKVKKFCKAGCLACSLCVRACPSQAIRVADNLAIIDFTPCSNCPVPLCLDVKCAPHVILPFPGVATPDVKSPKAHTAGLTTPSQSL
jgi:electron transport complex protein RnfB